MYRRIFLRYLRQVIETGEVVAGFILLTVSFRAEPLNRYRQSNRHEASELIVDDRALALLTFRHLMRSAYTMPAPSLWR